MFLIRRISWYNHCYWEWKEYLNSKILKHLKIKHIWIIFTHLKLLVAVATHNFKWVKI